MSRQEQLQAAVAKNKEYLANKNALVYHQRIEAYEAEIKLLDLVEADTDPETEADEPLSSDPSVAQGQLLDRIGVARNADWSTIKGAASPEQERLLVYLGVAGGPGTYADADYSLFLKYNEPSSPPDEENGKQSYGRKPEYAIIDAWKDILATEVD